MASDEGVSTSSIPCAAASAPERKRGTAGGGIAMGSTPSASIRSASSSQSWPRDECTTAQPWQKKSGVAWHMKAANGWRNVSSSYGGSFAYSERAHMPEGTSQRYGQNSQGCRRTWLVVRRWGCGTSTMQPPEEMKLNNPSVEGSW